MGRARSRRRGTRFRLQCRPKPLRGPEHLHPAWRDLEIGDTYSVARALVDSAELGAGNVPYRVKGLAVVNRLSFYYDSEYSLTPLGGGSKTVCLNMRAGCPPVAPKYL
jgi:hypothetical protein